MHVLGWTQQPLRAAHRGRRSALAKRTRELATTASKIDDAGLARRLREHGDMIKEVEGDILKSTARAIAHGIAPNDHFDHGLALSLREQWPAMAKDFRHWMHTHHAEPGGLWTWATPDGRRIVNLLTHAPSRSEKAHPGEAKLEFVNHALRELHAEIVREKIESIALPRLATGVGGLAWVDVKPLVQRHLGELAIPVYVYTTYKRDVVANEGSAQRTSASSGT